MKRAVALLVLGLANMASDLAGCDTLKALAVTTQASPAPKVFSSVRGLETYSTRFFVESTGSGPLETLELTPEVGSRLAGPYNRRNVYGAVLAYGPVLRSDPRTRPMFDAVATYALCGDAPLLRELGLRVTGRPQTIRVRLEPLNRALPANMPRVWEAPCR